MRIPGRLKDTTLGDVLGALHRERATGTLELRELGSARVHHVKLDEGEILGVDSALGPRLGTLLELDPDGARTSDDIRAGEAWVARGLVSNDRLRDALREQIRARLDQLFRLGDAELRFRIPRPREDDPTAPAPLGKDDFLVGRPRRRAPAPSPRAASNADAALRVLGLDAQATRADIQQAFRRLAQEAHPDRHPDADVTRRAELLRRFAEISRAYHALVG